MAAAPFERERADPRGDRVHGDCREAHPGGSCGINAVPGARHSVSRESTRHTIRARVGVLESSQPEPLARAGLVVSMHSSWSSNSGASVRCATAAWPRTELVRTRCSRWPTCILCGDVCSRSGRSVFWRRVRTPRRLAEAATGTRRPRSNAAVVLNSNEDRLEPIMSRPCSEPP